MKLNKNEDGAIDVVLVENPYRGNTFALEFSESPRLLENGGLKDRLVDWGCHLKDVSIVELTPAEDDQPGWDKMGSALGHLGRFVADHLKNGQLPIGLLGNCSSLIGGPRAKARLAFGHPPIGRLSSFALTHLTGSAHAPPIKCVRADCDSRHEKKIKNHFLPMPAILAAQQPADGYAGGTPALCRLEAA